MNKIREELWLLALEMSKTPGAVYILALVVGMAVYFIIQGL